MKKFEPTWIVIYTERTRKVKPLESIEELDKVIEEYNMGKNIYIQHYKLKYSPVFFKENFRFKNNRFWSRL